MAAMGVTYTLLTPAQVAKKFNVTTRTLERWRVQGVGPKFVKVCGSVRYRSDVVDQYVEESSQASTQG